MFVYIKTILFFIILLLRRSWHARFTNNVTRGCKKRRNRKHVAGVTEELDEELYLPDGFIEDTSFIAFTKGGHIATFRVNRLSNRTNTSQVLLEIPGTGNFTFSDQRPCQLGSRPLQLKMLDPMSRWKVCFRGPLQPSSPDDQVSPVHAYMSFYWESISDPFNHWSNVSCWQMAKNFSSYPLVSGIQTLLAVNNHTWYEQWGILRGRLEIDGVTEQTLMFRTLRSRRICLKGHEIENQITEHLVVDDGRLHITTGMSLSLKDSFAGRKFGSIVYPYGGRFAGNMPNLVVDSNKESTSLHYPFNIIVGRNQYQIEEEKAKIAILHSNIDSERVSYAFKTFSVNGITAFGVSVKQSGFIKAEMVCPAVLENNPCNLNTDRLVVSLGSEEFKCLPLVGGKGSQIAFLHTLQKQVPMAVCVTTSAFNYYVNTHADIKKKTEQLKNKHYENATSFQDICKDAVTLFKGKYIGHTITQAIQTELRGTFGEDFEGKRFAVRSSAISEDGFEASTAGQMETFLGVQGLDQILKAVSDCWASGLAYQVVEYRRQNGQFLVEPMGVIIQEMVDADVAGVLFTNDPVSGNTTLMVLNASEGLGETVVSGESTPDTYRIRRKKEDEIEIVESTPGEKNMKIVMTEESGVQRIKNESNTTSLCLDESQIYDLCRLGLELERTLGCPQDVEWAISDGILHILQTRAITGLDLETDEELIHEFDSSIALDTEFLTTCNIQEMAPGALTPLSVEIFIRLLNFVGNWITSCISGFNYAEYASKTIQAYSNQGFINMSANTMPYLHSVTSTKSFMEIFILGETTPQHTVETLQVYGGSAKSVWELIKCNVHDAIFRSPSQLRKFDHLLRNIDNFKIGENTLSASNLYSEIDAELYILVDTWKANLYKTLQSTKWSGILMKILTGNSNELTPEHNADLAVLLANCENVQSADVPAAVQDLALNIVTSGNSDTFMSLPDDKCHAFLIGAEEPLSTKYRDFLKKHGHRCVKEIELLMKSWEDNPSALMHSLKLIIKNGSYKSQKSQEMTPKEIVKKLRTPISPVTKFLMEKFLIQKARSGVRQRELGKSFTIKTQNVIKKAYWKLAAVMVQESRIPEEELLFFLTHREIGTLIETRSPSLIRRAKRRKRIFSVQEAVRYPKFNAGYPVPRHSRNQTAPLSGFSVRGMTVGRGVAEGRACIIRRLEDADNIEKGDILICPYTDVGWTPYFSMISGLVTEMGGLLSHGSVVAREMGLPCIVNVVDVTDVFLTGDYVRLDGAAGTVTKILSDETPAQMNSETAA